MCVLVCVCVFVCLTLSICVRGVYVFIHICMCVCIYLPLSVYPTFPAATSVPEIGQFRSNSSELLFLGSSCDLCRAATFWLSKTHTESFIHIRVEVLDGSVFWNIILYLVMAKRLDSWLANAFHPAGLKQWLMDYPNIMKIELHLIRCVKQGTICSVTRASHDREAIYMVIWCFFTDPFYWERMQIFEALHN